MQRRGRLVVVAAWSCALALTACDMKIIDDDGPAIIDPTPGPTQGTVSDDPAKADWGGPDPVVDDEPAPRLDGLAYLNAVRGGLGLGTLSLEDALSTASERHAGFLAANWATYEADGLSPHRQEETLPGFTGASSLDRAAEAGYGGLLRSEVIAFKATSAAAVEAWLDTLYHRLPLLRAGISEVGYGEAAGADGLMVNVALVGRPPVGAWEAPAPPDAFVLYPPDGAEDVPFAWSGREVPQPKAPPAGYPSGPVVTLSAVAGEVALEIAEIAPVSGGPLAATVLTQANDAHLSGADVAIIPHAPLEAGARYVVTVRGRLDGEAFVRSWRFVTAPEWCSPTSDACGPGRGCYPSDGEMVCGWEGTGVVDDGCRSHNDCEPGLGCLGAVCRPLCATGPATDPKAWRCDELCPQTAVPVSDSAGICGAERGCDGSSCAEGQGCYYASAGLMCAWAGDGARGEACTYANDCAAGLTCMSSTDAADAVCHALCGGPGMPACADTCDGGVLVVDAEVGVKACP